MHRGVLPVRLQGQVKTVAMWDVSYWPFSLSSVQQIIDYETLMSLNTDARPFSVATLSAQ